MEELGIEGNSTGVFHLEVHGPRAVLLGVGLQLHVVASLLMLRYAAVAGHLPELTP